MELDWKSTGQRMREQPRNLQASWQGPGGSGEADLEHKTQRTGPRVSAQEEASVRGPADGELHLLKLASSSRRRAPRHQETAIGLQGVHKNYTLKRRRRGKHSLKHRCCSLGDFSSGSFLLKCWIHDQKRTDIYF